MAVNASSVLPFKDEPVVLHAHALAPNGVHEQLDAFHEECPHQRWVLVDAAIAASIVDVWIRTSMSLSCQE